MRKTKSGAINRERETIWLPVLSVHTEMSVHCDILSSSFPLLPSRYHKHSRSRLEHHKNANTLWKITAFTDIHSTAEHAYQNYRQQKLALQ